MRTTDQHSRPTSTLAADEIRRLVRDDDAARGSDSVRRERIDTPTTEMSAMAIGELLAAEPRTSPAIISRELRRDTVTDAKPAAATAPAVRELTRPAAQEPRVRIVFLIAGIAAVAIAAILLLR